jgi:hypothetical protein
MHFGRGDRWRVGGTIDMAQWPFRTAFLVEIRCPPEKTDWRRCPAHLFLTMDHLGSSWCPAAAAAPILTSAPDRKEEEAGGGG